MRLPKVSSNVQYEVIPRADGMRITVSCAVGGEKCGSSVEVPAHVMFYDEMAVMFYDEMAERAIEHVVEELSREVGRFIVRGTK